MSLFSQLYLLWLQLVPPQKSCWISLRPPSYQPKSHCLRQNHSLFTWPQTRPKSTPSQQDLLAWLFVPGLSKSAVNYALLLCQEFQLLTETMKHAVHPAVTAVGGNWDQCLAETSVSVCPQPSQREVSIACTTGSLSAGLQLLCRTSVVSTVPSFSSWERRHRNASLFPGLGCT